MPDDLQLDLSMILRDVPTTSVTLPIPHGTNKTKISTPQKERKPRRRLREKNRNSSSRNLQKILKTEQHIDKVFGKFFYVAFSAQPTNAALYQWVNRPMRKTNERRHLQHFNNHVILNVKQKNPMLNSPRNGGAIGNQ